MSVRVRQPPTHLPTQSAVVDIPRRPIRSLIPPLKERLGHDHHALPGDIVGLEELAEDSLRVALGIGIGRVEGLLFQRVPFALPIKYRILTLIPAS